MTGLPGPSERPGVRGVPAHLLALHSEGFTGSVVLSGAPGGTIHLEQGLVTAVETPGAPSVESLLLRSGRVHESAWVAAETAVSGVDANAAAAARDRDLGAVLIARGVIGTAELDVVCAAAVVDGAFALALAGPGVRETVEASPPARIALRPGITPQRLFEETTRRTALLDRLTGRPPGELARTRIRPAALLGAEGPRIPVRYRDVLDAATGRRTARDIGFALGRGVFAVLLDVVRMDALHLLHREPVSGVPMAPSVAPRTARSGPSTAPVGPLPRRLPGEGSRSSTLRRPTRSEGAPLASDSPSNEHPAERTETTEKSAP
ncbi:hypothetical protein OG618_01880 [Kitasatospora sp. NBC_01246]|uniref:hypothetical protein n=1 Tax=Kitasatospora sp. NBC_01246 TaxID=2903570 RepID=UPI002E33511B|nr:hypothetical protein [Kitasatospora sp. NBC_01246]